MDKEQFAKYMYKLNSYIEKEKAIDNALRSLSPDFGGFSMNDILDDMADLLAIIVGDKEDWIGYYIWETDFGSNGCADSVTEEDGTKIPFKTPEDLYNLIMSEDNKDDEIANYLIGECNKYKQLYENEKEHSDTLQRIIDKITKDMIDAVVPEEAAEVQKKTATTTDSTPEEIIDNINKVRETLERPTTNVTTITLDELVDNILEKFIEVFKENEEN